MADRQKHKAFLEAAAWRLPSISTQGGWADVLRRAQSKVLGQHGCPESNCE